MKDSRRTKTYLKAQESRVAFLKMKVDDILWSPPSQPYAEASLHGFIAQKPVISILLLFYLDRSVEDKSLRRQFWGQRVTSEFRRWKTIMQKTFSGLMNICHAKFQVNCYSHFSVWA